jgi:putative RNA 2'-phosphotransferase
MTPKETTLASKFLSLVLRYQPDAAGIVLDAAAWVNVDALLAGCANAGRSLSREQLEHVVITRACP